MKTARSSSPVSPSSSYNAWVTYMKSRRGMWTIDQIHNGVGGKDLLAYASYAGDHSSGVYVMVNNGKVDSGTFRDAVPHIGEATFSPKWSKDFGDHNEAIATVMTRLGVRFLLDVTHTRNPALP